MRQGIYMILQVQPMSQCGLSSLCLSYYDNTYYNTSTMVQFVNASICDNAIIQVRHLHSAHARRILGAPITLCCCTDYARQVCTSTIENCVSVCISHMNNEYPVHMHAEYYLVVLSLI